MGGTASPGGDGPTFAPPQLPPGWIAQWDGGSRKYYFVQLATGVSQWDTPTDAAPVGGGGTPADARIEHPYGVPGQAQLITHPDGSQTVKHADGTMEPIMPPEAATAGAARGGAERGVDGPAGERGIGSFAVNALLNGRQNQGGGSSSALGQLVSGVMHGGQSSATGSGGLGGKIVGQLASNMFHSNRPQQGQNYYGAPPPQNSGGIGSVVGGLFGGQQAQNPGGQNYGYSNAGQAGGYSGQAPPATYQPPAMGPYPGQGAGSGPSYQPPPQSQPMPQSYPPPPSQSNPYGQPQLSPSFPPPPGQAPYGQHSPLSEVPPSQRPYGQGQQQPPPPYSAQSSGYNAPWANIPPPPAAGSNQPYGSSSSGYGAAPPIPHATHPHHQQQGYGAPY